MESNAPGNFLNRPRYVAAIVALLTLIAIFRVVQTYRATAETFDEPCHISAALELLDKGTYTLDPYNTPLARIFIGFPLLLDGEHYPHQLNDDPNSRNYNYVGNQILYGDGHYMRNLVLARCGVLPFLPLAVVVIFLWARREYGNFAAVIAVALFTTLPVILAFSSIAYSDMAPAFAQTAALFAFTSWLNRPPKKSSILMGLTAGLALLAKFTTLIYFPAAAALIFGCRWLMRSHERTSQRGRATRSVRQIALASIVALTVIWAGYRFSIGRVQESMHLSPQAMPSFQHFPARLRPLARRIVVSDPILPAPGLFAGIADAYAFNKEGPPSYFLGRVRKGGWWYFFLADVALKSPVPFLLLCVVGFVTLARFARYKQWTALAPGVAVFGVLMATMTVSVYYGIRHVIVVFPLLSIVAGAGGAYLWRLQGKPGVWGRLLLVTLLLWQAYSTIAARHDYIAYFNGLAGHDPSKIFVMGCDLDCGRDLIRLSAALRAKHISSVSIAMWTSADMAKTNLPAFTVPKPYQPITGHLAISLRSLRMGDVFHETYPAGAFAWLDKYQPVERIGKTILLYYIPEKMSADSAESASLGQNLVKPPKRSFFAHLVDSTAKIQNRGAFTLVKSV